MADDENAANCNGVAVPRNTLTVVDNRTGKKHEVPVTADGFVNASDLKPLGLMSFDPGFLNTAVCKSAICYIDGDKGILQYRGYNIEDLIDGGITFVETAFLLIHGELPSPSELEAWQFAITHHTCLHENLVDMLKAFRYDAHPMSMVICGLSALASFYPEANPALQGASLYFDDKSHTLRNKQIYRILGKLPTIAACAYRHRIGRAYNSPNNALDYPSNFLFMLDKLSENNYRPHPKLARALDILFILHAEHELNCSTAALRHLVSSGVDPYTALAGAAGALYGPLHGGANEAVLNMLLEIRGMGGVAAIPTFLEKVKRKECRLSGFGHRVYKNYDPRARIVRRVAYEVFDVVGRDSLIELAEALEQAALKDDYFISRKLYPNVDFYTGLIYKAMGFPLDMAPVLFAIPRAAGWLAHWCEALEAEEQRIFRPRQMYVGPEARQYVPLAQRQTKEGTMHRMEAFVSNSSKRREAGFDGDTPLSKEKLS